MIRLIIIALVSFSSATFATPIGEKKAELQSVLNCEANLLSSLGPARQEMLARIGESAHRIETVTLIMPSQAENNMGISIARFYDQMIAAARAVLNPNTKAASIEQNLALIELNSHLAVTMNVKDMFPRNNDIREAKRKMETRAFEDDWSTLDHTQPEPKKVSQDTTNFGAVEGMPTTPFDFNQAKAAKEEPSLPKSELMGDIPQGPHDYNKAVQATRSDDRYTGAGAPYMHDLNDALYVQSVSGILGKNVETPSYETLGDMPTGPHAFNAAAAKSSDSANNGAGSPYVHEGINYSAILEESGRNADEARKRLEAAAQPPRRVDPYDFGDANAYNWPPREKP